MHMQRIARLRRIERSPKTLRARGKPGTLIIGNEVVSTKMEDRSICGEGEYRVRASIADSRMKNEVWYQNPGQLRLKSLPQCQQCDQDLLKQTALHITLVLRESDSISRR